MCRHIVSAACVVCADRLCMSHIPRLVPLVQARDNHHISAQASRVQYTLLLLCTFVCALRNHAFTHSEIYKHTRARARTQRHEWNGTDSCRRAVDVLCVLLQRYAACVFASCAIHASGTRAYVLNTHSHCVCVWRCVVCVSVCDRC